VGYVLALILLLSISRVSWIFLVFPLWILLIRSTSWIENYRRGPNATVSGSDTAASGSDAAASSPAK